MRIGVAQFGNGDILGDGTVSGASLIQAPSKDLGKVKKGVEGLGNKQGFNNMAQAFAFAEKMLPLGGHREAVGELGGAEAEAEGNADDVEKTCRGLPDGEARLAAHRTQVSRSLGPSPRRLVSCGSR